MDIHIIIYNICTCLAIRIVSAEFNINNYKMGKVNDTQYGETLESVKVFTELICWLKCSEDKQCYSATFDEAKKMCKTNRSWANSSVLCFEVNGRSCPGAIEYAEKNNILTTMRLVCHSDTNCVDSNSLCVMGQCQCKPGYSYNGTSHACVIACASYGTTFQADYGKRLIGNNEVTKYNVGVDDCKLFCIAETSFACKTIEYSNTLLRCHLQQYTAFDMPGNYTTSTSKDLYTRDCSN